MSKVIAIFGAGTGLGVSLARRFGREGFRVALIARRPDRLASLVTELASDGIEAVAFPADLTDHTGIPTLVSAITERFGRIDVIEYGPVPAGQAFTSATELSAATLEAMMSLYLLSPIEAVRAVLPGMLDRGDGAVLFTHGLSAMMPAAHFSGPGPLMSAARNYLHSLNGELSGTGVYAGTINVAGAIARSENEPPQPEPSQDGVAFGGVAFPTIDPDDIAAQYWEMYIARTQVEAVIPELSFG